MIRVSTRWRLKKLTSILTRLQHLLRAALLGLSAAVCYAIGWAVGVGVRCALWCVAAAVAGYQAGRARS